MARKEIIIKVSDYIKILNESGVHIEKAFLYGSAARNEENTESDIDVMLVSKRFDDKTDDHVIGLIWRLTRKIDPRIEPYAVGLDRFIQDDVSPLLQLVRKEGILIDL
ncbi:MAG: nucleotidyltransferase domain-containing protein [Bacteroidota bacterium]